MNIQHIRHATFIVEIAGKKLLVDPMLCDKGAMAPIPASPNQQRNPLVELPKTTDEILDVDAILLTHNHFDHFDDAAKEKFSKKTPVICQAGERKKTLKVGFEHVSEVHDMIIWEGIEIHRTEGKHGRGVVGKAMGKSSGYVLKSDGEPVLYISGDTIYYEGVEMAIEQHRPEAIVCYGGAAQFLKGGPITMSKEGIMKVRELAKEAALYVVHLDAMNHCIETREVLEEALNVEHNIDARLLADGELTTVIK